MSKSGMSQAKAEQKLVAAFRRYQQYRKLVGKPDTSIQTSLQRFVQVGGHDNFFNPKWKDGFSG